MDTNLLEQAKRAREKAYVPYSRFKVGAALLTKSGRVFSGCNVENASFGLTCCAERVALFSAVVAGEREFTDLVVLTDSEEPATPCGACRQVLYEFAPKLRIVTANLEGKKKQYLLTELLPHAFSEFSPEE